MLNKSLFIGLAIGVLICIFVPSIPGMIKSWIP